MNAHSCNNDDCPDCNPCDYAPCFPEGECDFDCDCSCHLPPPSPLSTALYVVAALIVLAVFAVWWIDQGRTP